MMQLLRLVVRNAVAWFTMQMAISYFMMKVPVRWIEGITPFFRTFSWEQEGRLWERLSIRRWKKVLPDSSAFYQKSYNHRQLQSTDIPSLRRFSLETVRAELTHWLSLLVFPLFYLWNPRWAARLNVVYAVISNLPFIVAQRYNRPKVVRIIQKKGATYVKASTTKR